MPNQLNFPDPILSTKFQRPSRVSARDRALIQGEDRPVLFGTDPRDGVELYVYNGDGSIAGNLRIDPTDTVLGLTTVVDQSGTEEVLNIDFVTVANRLQLQPGRYALSLHFFRDEVGSEAGYKMYISEISPDRTEVRLEPVAPTGEVLKDVYEFVVPSVPKLYAQGLIDQTFGKSLDAGPNETIMAFVDAEVERLIPGTMARLQASDTYGVYRALVTRVLDDAYVQALNNMAVDTTNRAVQQVEIEAYVKNALNTILYNTMQSGNYDHRILLR